MTAAPDVRRRWATVGGLAVGGLAYLLVLMDFRFDPTRTATRAGWFSNFYELQAKAFMSGRLDVPAGSLGIEGFVVDGRTYTYFGPVPALLRIPALLVTDAFYGRMTVASMALGWVVFAAATAALLWRVHTTVFAGRPTTTFHAWCGGTLLAAVTGGSALTYDAALPWVYHEAYVWAEATAMLSLLSLSVTLANPTRRNALLLGAASTATILSRTPAGWAVCAATVASAVWYARRRLRERYPDAWATLAGAALVPLGVGVAYNILKFHHPWLFPLQHQVWTLVNERRREALAANGGSITGPQFLETSFVNYFRPDGIHLTPYFPFVSLPPEPAAAYGGAFLDQSYRTGSVTAFMPLLFVLTVAALPYLLRRGVRHEVAALRPLLLGGVLVSMGVMGYGYLSNRYTSDFVPGLAMGSVIGLWACVRLVERRLVTRAVLVTAVACLGVFGVLAQVAVAAQTAAQSWRGDRLAAYLDLQNRVSGGPGSARAALVSRGDGLPSGGRADDLRISGDCDAVYLNTGDTYEPWILVEQRAKVVVVRLDDDVRPGTVALARLHGNSVRTISLETDAEGRFRVVVLDGELRTDGPWVRPLPGDEVRVGIGFDTSTSTAEITSTPGGRVGTVPYVEWGTDWFARPGRFEWAAESAGRVARLGVTLERGEGLELGLCRRLLADLA